MEKGEEVDVQEIKKTSFTAKGIPLVDTFDKNGNRIATSLTERRDQFRFDKPGAGVSIQVNFTRAPLSDPAPPMSVPR